MSNNIERKMEFIIEQQATFVIDISQLKEVHRPQAESIDKLTGDVAKLTLNVTNLTGNQAELTVNVAELTVNVAGLTETVRENTRTLHLAITEMRQGFDNLIVANEVTRKLAEDVGRLALGY